MLLDSSGFSAKVAREFKSIIITNDVIPETTNIMRLTILFAVSSVSYLEKIISATSIHYARSFNYSKKNVEVLTHYKFIVVMTIFFSLSVLIYCSLEIDVYMVTGNIR